ncbi:hypothetical protein HZS_7432, partial [Henneguya salminicola]
MNFTYFEKKFVPIQIGCFYLLMDFLSNDTCKNIKEDLYMGHLRTYIYLSPKQHFLVYKETLDFTLHFALIISTFISYVFACFGFCGRSSARTFIAVMNFLLLLFSVTECILRGANIYPKLPL